MFAKSISGVFGLSDEERLNAMAIAKRDLGVQLEPGGAVAMAALLGGALAEDASLQTLCIILSGGNVDPEIAKRADKMLA